MQRTPNTQLKGAIYRADISLREQIRADKEVNREEYAAIIYVDKDKFFLRMHDEMTEGGRRLCLEEIPVPAFEPPTITDGVFPDIPEGTTFAALDFDLTASGDLDMSSWVPTGLADGAHLRIRKVDNSPSIISYTDNRGVNYHFLNKYSEFMSFVWVADPGALRII